jgi:hypothetical protein
MHSVARWQISFDITFQRLMLGVTAWNAATGSGSHGLSRIEMTLPNERTRALLWAGGYLIELARDDSLPLEIRRHAVLIARHFPTIEDVAAMALLRHPIGHAAVLAPPDEVDMGGEGGRFDPLRYSTRLVWPEDV